ncbi:MAG: M10 family metallopeptidase C-terminal domain-containing protein [Pseudomonadota bacterium]
MSGLAWQTPVTVSFDGYGNGSNTSLIGETPVSANLRAAVSDAIESVATFTNLDISLGNGADATVRIASADGLVHDGQTRWLGPGAFAFLPGNSALAGDIAFGNGTTDFAPGTYGHYTVLHEIGHALGLKQPNEAGPHGRLAAADDSMMLSVMSARSVPGAPLSAGLTVEPEGFAQTFMPADIAALQHMYGADFSDRGNTVYRFDPAERVLFETIWDGGGRDTFDFSRYRDDLVVDLTPGAATRTGQEAELNRTERLANGADPIYADGAIYNAFLFEGDTRSLIEDARAGAGDDLLRGNQAKNQLHGGDGGDTLEGFGANDRLFGQAGDDHVFGHGGHDRVDGGTGDDWLAGGGGRDTLVGRSGEDWLDGGAGVDRLVAGGGDDTLIGAGGHDTLLGQGGDDRLIGNTGADRLDGGGGRDTLIGGKGGDTLTADEEGDRLIGGKGRDTFVVRDGGTITDLERVDFLDLGNPDALATAVTIGHHVELETGSGALVTLLHTDVQMLFDDMFL